MKILVVEDEFDLADVIKKGLQEDGFTVDAANDGQKALDLFNSRNYDLVILDLMLPVISGFNILKKIRNNNKIVQILILTAKSKVEDKVSGLDLGADDYLTKPFAFKEFKARVRALLRRKNKVKSRYIKISNLTIDTISHNVTRNHKEIELTVKEYSVLEYLAQNRGQILTRTQIEEHVWDYRFGNTSNIVDVYIRYLRKKIDQDFKPKLIKTVRGKGYKLQVSEK